MTDVKPTWVAGATAAAGLMFGSGGQLVSTPLLVAVDETLVAVGIDGTDGEDLAGLTFGLAEQAVAKIRDA